MQHPIVNTAIKAARRAGNIILRHADRIDRLQVIEKSTRDYVSEVDRIAEEEIIDIIRQSYPDHGILAEESGRVEGQDYQWIIDPLDGTTNYLHGYPDYCVSIGVRKNSQMEHGVIFDPLRDELFVASRGQGAQLNERRMRVSKTRKLANSLLATGIPFGHVRHFEAWLTTYRSLMTRASGIRQSGATALNLAHLGCGRIDGIWVVGNKTWDLAAGSLLVQEAGGFVADFNGADNPVDTGNIVAGNNAIFEALQPIVLKYLGHLSAKKSVSTDS